MAWSSPGVQYDRPFLTYVPLQRNPPMHKMQPRRTPVTHGTDLKLDNKFDTRVDQHVRRLTSPAAKTAGWCIEAFQKGQNKNSGRAMKAFRITRTDLLEGSEAFQRGQNRPSGRVVKPFKRARADLLEGQRSLSKGPEQIFWKGSEVLRRGQNKPCGGQ